MNLKSLLLSLAAVSGISGLPAESRAGENEQSQLQDKVPTKPEDVRPLGVGADIPDVKVKDGKGNWHSLQHVVGLRPTVLIFYRGGWCPFCNIHLGELASIQPELKSLGYQIVAVSPDHPGKIAEALDQHEFPYALYSDSTMHAARAFGLAFQLDSATVKQYKEEYKIDIEADSGETHHQLPVPAAFLVSQDGRIRFAYSNADYKTRIKPEELLQAAREYSAVK